MRTRAMTIAAMCALLLAGATRAQAQVSPCDVAGDAEVVLHANSLLYANLPDHQIQVNGSNLVTGYRYQVWNKATGSPSTGPFVQDVVVAHDAFALVSGTTDCYRASVPAITGLPANTSLLAMLTPVTAVPPTVPALPSGPSNPFKSVQARATAVRLGQ